jgi:translation initiation factor IF-2
MKTLVDILSKQGIEVDDNPNTRVNDHAVEVLAAQMRDKDRKAQLEDLLTRRTEANEAQQEASAPAKPIDKSKPAEPKAEKTAPIGPKVVGSIPIDKEGNVIPASAQATTKETAKPAEKPVAKPVEEKPHVEKVPVEKKETKPSEKEVKDSAKPEKPAEKPAEKTVTKQVKKPVEKPHSENKEKKQTHQAEKQQNKEAKQDKPKQEVKKADTPKHQAPNSKVEDKPNEEKVEKPTNDVIYRPKSVATTPQVKIVGTIDLDSIKDSTRPKKKSKDARKRGEADRKKRKRIGQKVDIEQAVKQPGFGSDQKKKSEDGGKHNNSGNAGNGNPNANGNGNGKKQNDRRKDRPANDRRNNKKRAPEKQEISNEDVQRQVKETLARLTNKTTKKSAKWRKEKREEFHNRELENARREEAESRVLKLTEFVTANDLANMMEVPVNNVIATCMNLGVMVSINQRLDAETINIVADEFGFTTEYVSAEVSEAITVEEDTEEQLQSRPPIVTVMGHVDHGKTSLLDYIRKANVIAGEAGGITQHIGAYNVKLNDGRHITFLDTPGHEAFTAMRARGAKVTDLAIIIVAADDDVMPQTVEAINHASAAGVPIVFAINKIDKPTANPDKIKEQLAAMNYLVEDWGGKYQSQDISAKKGIGVNELMEKVLLEAEMLDLKANPDRRAIGSIIESSLDKGRGYVATVLVQNGTLKVGDVVLAGTNYGKIKAMFNERNQRVKEAGPATPVLVLGLNGAPTAGDTFNVMETEQEAREIASKREQLQRELGLRTKKRLGLEELGRRRALNDFHELNLVVKGDVDGSVEALSDSLIKLSTPEVQVNVLHKGVGAISESDVTLAAASDAIIIGFQVRPSGAARKEAEKEGVEIRLYSVIYKAIEEVKDAMEGMLSPEIKEEITGTAEVLQTYHISKVGTIAGAVMRDGKIKRSCKVRVIRDGIVIYTGELGSLKRFKDDVKEVVSGYEFGVSVQGYNDVREGDMIEAFEEIEVKKSL